MNEQNGPRTETANSIEVLCRDFHAAWQANKRPDIDAFLSRVEDDRKERLLAELVVLDMAERRRLAPRFPKPPGR